MSKETGGPAFPCEQHETQNGEWNQSFESGMTLRDYFAVNASEEDIASAANLVKPVPTTVRDRYGHVETVPCKPANTRQLARYIHADLMLKARGG